MAFLAVLYGLVKEGSVWYPINLLAAGASAKMAALPLEGLREFHADGFLLACVIHLLTSLMVGVLYGVMLPMFPRSPILLGGLVAPLLWTGLLHATLELINPALNDRVAWPWFMVTQMAFGLATGFVVARAHPLATMQTWSLAERAGVHASRTPAEREREP